MASNPHFQIPSRLKRYPQRKRELLQAWDSADELLVAHLNELQSTQSLSGKKVLILNDAFGALCCALSSLQPTVYSDSYVSHQGIRINCPQPIPAICRLEDLQGEYDLVLIRIPKNMSFFEDTLGRLQKHLSPNAQIICGVMVKHLASSSFDLLEKFIGKTSTSLAQKKARLIFANWDSKNLIRTSSTQYPLQVRIEGFTHPFLNHSNLFSREKLDIGTRFLLENLPQGDFQSILDLGCGNGIVGIAAKLKNPKAHLLFSDESQMAIQSAQANSAAYFQNADAEFHWTHCFEKGSEHSVDLVICNPPFHQGTTLGDFIALQMFKDAHHVLRPGGLLRVIGNSHLKYPTALKRIFGNSQIVATHPKFVIADAIRS